jgi:hypothetical protein
VLLDVDQEGMCYWRAKLYAELDSLREWELLKNSSSYAIMPKTHCHCSTAKQAKPFAKG